MDRNIILTVLSLLLTKSLSARRAWIEIRCRFQLAYTQRVALRKESVDRNEGVIAIKEYSPVALRKESVDRNMVISYNKIMATASLSARRAWIEISQVRPIMVISRRRSPQGERG